MGTGWGAPEAPHPIVKNVTPCEFGESMELWEPDGVGPLEGGDADESDDLPF